MVTEMHTAEWEEMAGEKKGRNVRAGEGWVSARVPESAIERITEMATREERSMSFIVRRLILEALEVEQERER